MNVPVTIWAGMFTILQVQKIQRPKYVINQHHNPCLVKDFYGFLYVTRFPYGKNPPQVTMVGIHYLSQRSRDDLQRSDGFSWIPNIVHVFRTWTSARVAHARMVPRAVTLSLTVRWQSLRSNAPALQDSRMARAATCSMSHCIQLQTLYSTVT